MFVYNCDLKAGLVVSVIICLVAISGAALFNLFSKCFFIFLFSINHVGRQESKFFKKLAKRLICSLAHEARVVFRFGWTYQSFSNFVSNDDQVRLSLLD